MPNEQINSGLFLALSCEILSSVQTAATTCPDTWDHTTNIVSPHLTLRHQTILLPRRTKSIVQKNTVPQQPQTSKEQLFMLFDRAMQTDDRLTFNYVLRAP